MIKTSLLVWENCHSTQQHNQAWILAQPALVLAVLVAAFMEEILDYKAKTYNKIKLSASEAHKWIHWCKARQAYLIIQASNQESKARLAKTN